MKKFDAGLQKVRDASEELASQRRHLSDMEEAHRNMTTKVADLVSSINQLKSELSQVLSYFPPLFLSVPDSRFRRFHIGPIVIPQFPLVGLLEQVTSVS